MNKEQIENNKLIAEFMDWAFDEDSERYTTPHTVQVYFDDIPSNDQWDCMLKPEEMEFHLSWDWIMPVAEKIGELYHRIRIEYDEGCQLCTIFAYNKNGELVEEIYADGHSWIESTYNTIVKFIEWYNVLSRNKKQRED